jgi:hypothetical protein
MDHNLNIQLEKKSGGLSRRVLIIVFVVLVAAPLVVLVTWQFVARYQGQRAVEELAVRLQTYEQDLLNAKMEDRYGGSTPQETLSLYIRAVESGDYELASKYFIEKKRDQELNGLKNSELVALKNITSLLKQTLANPGSYSDDKAGFTIRKPLLVDFEKYPNGIWKIVEI